MLVDAFLCDVLSRSEKVIKIHPEYEVSARIGKNSKIVPGRLDYGISVNGVT